MIHAVRDLGEFIARAYNKDDLEAFVSDLGVDLVLLISMKVVDSNVSYNGIYDEQYDPENFLKYLYRKTSANAPYATPTAIIAGGDEKDLIKTFEKKIIKWFDKKNITQYLEKIKTTKRTDVDDKLITQLREVLESEKDRILNDLLEKFKTYTRKKIAISMCFEDENGNRKYFYDYPIFREIVKETAKKRYYEKYDTRSLAENAVCSVCGREKDEVYGFVTDIFPFYTLDKINFAPDFQRELGWKLYPVCYDCAKYLEFGKRYLDQNLRFTFYGEIPFYVIPKFLFGISKDILERIQKWQSPSFAETSGNGKTPLSYLFYDEDIIIQELSRLENTISFTLLFYRMEQQAFRILLAASDILPSRLSTLYKVKEKIDDAFPFKGEKIAFNFKLVRDIFPKNPRIGVFDNYYVDVSGRIIMGKKLSYMFLLKHIIDRARESFVANVRNASDGDKTFGQFRKLFLGFFAVLKYVSMLGQLDIVKEDENVSLEDIQIEGENIVEMAEKFFEANKEFFDTPAKKAIFLMGVLTQKLLNIQFSDRKATPFMSKLNGLKLSKRLIIKLLPEVQNKLEEYKKNYYRDIEEKIAEYFVKAGDNWQMNNDEISFYFVLGMNLARRFKVKREEEEVVEEEVV